jgi:uncharacterized protein (AIM24 family)
MSNLGGTYVCRYCRQVSDPGSATCPLCGAKIDVRAVASDSGWQEQPAIRDMARIQFGQSTCQIEGTMVPSADFGLAGGDWIYFSHHSLLWLEPSVRVQAMKMKGGWNRRLAGMPVVMVQAGGPGHVALSDDHPGEVVALPLAPNQSIVAREHRFLAATSAVHYDWVNSGVWFTTGTGDDVETHFPLGQYVDRFAAVGGPGLMLLHSPGNTFIRDLAPGQSILLQPTALLYWDTTVRLNIHFEYPRPQGWMNTSQYSYRTVWLRASGPGRIAMQSVFERPETSVRVTSNSGATSHRW